MARGRDRAGIGGARRIAHHRAHVAGLAAEGLHRAGHCDRLRALAQLCAARLHLDDPVGGEPDAEGAAVGCALAKALALADQGQPGAAAIAAGTGRFTAAPVNVLARRLQRVVGMAWLRDDLAERTRSATRAQVAGAHLRRVEPNQRGQPVDLPFERELHLRRAKPAERAGHAVVGVNRAPGQLHGVEAIRADGVFERGAQHLAAVGGIRAGVEQQVHPVGQQVPGRVAGRAHPHARGVAFDPDGSALGPVVMQPDSAPGAQRQHAGDRLDGQAVLAAERTPGHAGHHPDARGIEAEDSGQFGGVAERIVGAGVDQQAAVAVRLDDAALGLHEGVHLPPGLVDVVDPVCGVAESGRYVPGRVVRFLQ